MTTEDLKLELNKITTQQQQWHDEFIQRDNHWIIQRGIWYISIGIGVGMLFVKSGIV